MAIFLVFTACGHDSGPESAATRSSSTDSATTVLGGGPATTTRTTVRGRTTTAKRRPTPTPTARPRPPTTRADGATCITPQLRAEPISVRPDKSSLVETFRVTNAGPNTCVVDGSPGVLPYRASGSSVQATVVAIPAGEGEIGRAGRPLLLGVGEAAVFYLQYSPTTPPTACQDIDGIIFNAPGQTASPAKIPFGVRFCGRVLRLSAMLSP